MAIPAYLDSAAGLIPCHAIRLDRDGLNIVVRFRKGGRAEALGLHGEQTWGRWIVVPRDKVRGQRSMKGARILPYNWLDYLPA